MNRISVLFLLAACATSGTSVQAPDYNRKEWRHWIDEDRDCQNTRQEVLIQESEEPVTYKNGKQCSVATGRWTDPYTGSVIVDPGLLDIDHVVALRDAHDSGGHAWDAEKKRAFANDLTEAHLIAVHRSANRSKGSKGPDEWLPPNPEYRCAYVEAWLEIKRRWELTMTDCERATIEYIQKICAEGGTPPTPQ